MIYHNENETGKTLNMSSKSNTYGMVRFDKNTNKSKTSYYIKNKLYLLLERKYIVIFALISDYSGRKGRTKSYFHRDNGCKFKNIKEISAHYIRFLQVVQIYVEHLSDHFSIRTKNENKSVADKLVATGKISKKTGKGTERRDVKVGVKQTKTWFSIKSLS